ncbi:hypothetical protein JET14_13180 [Martelella lutilitoris]|uniref:LamG domain-containing protein n=1 Tax=Martelella lutilitoris TaxID=2583532 RepID=A0A7T7HHG5_9HYPH|nr:hypothetical protein [Martelella lutilitoris]QQM29280.1 hypothetical protein JET14_13180 [Martelella lutilitoris]
MAGFQLDGYFTDPLVPYELASTPVMAIPGLSWFQPAPSLIAVSGSDVTQLNDRAGGAATLTPSNTDREALYAADAPDIGGSALHFDGVGAKQYLINGSGLDTTGPYTVSLVAKYVEVTTASPNKMLLGSAGNNWFLGRTAAGNMRLNSGTGQVNVAYDESKWFSVVASFDGTTTASVSISGGAPVTGTVQNLASSGFVLSGISSGGGAYWEGYINNVQIIDGLDLHAEANAARLAALHAFNEAVYGVPAG